MKKFTKTLVAAATLALVSGPALAVNGYYYDGNKASIKLSGGGCKTDRENNVDMEIMFHSGMGGHNTGYWQSSLFRFGNEIDGEGPLIISKTGRTAEDAPRRATMDVGGDEFYALFQVLEYYAMDECKDFDGMGWDYNQITRFDAAWSKNGEQVDVRLDAQTMYYNTNDREKNLKFRLRSGRLNLNNPM